MRASRRVVRQGRRGRVAGRDVQQGVLLDKGDGVAAPDYPAAAGWYTRAADAGIGDAAANLAAMYTVGRGRAWQIMPATSTPPHCRSPFLELNGAP